MHSHAAVEHLQDKGDADGEATAGRCGEATVGEIRGGDGGRR
jgi:hypothetical protein